MADVVFRGEELNPLRKRTDWGAIWGGVFVFMAIWSVFGALGLAIFASVANPSATQPVMGMSVGFGIWSIVLTTIAMYVAGRETGRLAGVSSRHDGLTHGMIMFGLSIAGLMLLFTVGGSVLNGGTAASVNASPYAFTVFADLGWIGFVALFLGWIAAMIGSSQGAVVRLERTTPREIRPAA